MWGTANPKREGWYLCTVQINSQRYVIPLQRYEYPKNNWHWNGLNCGKVVASQKFPLPYNKEDKC